MLKISVLVSGNGTNLQALIDAIEAGELPQVEIVQVISSNSAAFSLERAQLHGIKNRTIGKENYPEPAARTQALIAQLQKEDTDLVVLAGYMSVLEAPLIAAYPEKIINIHPSLIPKYCGKGFYGKRVHQAVLDAEETFTGATVHYVDEGVDTGPVLLQRVVPVFREDTVDTLAKRVLAIEHEILIAAVKKIAAQWNANEMES